MTPVYALLLALMLLLFMVSGFCWWLHDPKDYWYARARSENAIAFYLTAGILVGLFAGLLRLVEWVLS